MQASIRKITKSEFETSNATLLFDDKPFARCFAEVFTEDVCFKCSWRSHLIEPSLLESEVGVYCLGVDQDFCVIDFHTSSVLLKISLDNLFYTVKSVGNSILVVTASEIITISKTTNSIIQLFDLPDLFEDFVELGNVIKVRCMNGDVVNIAGS